MKYLMYLCLKELKINKLTMKRQMIITLALALTMTMPTFDGVTDLRIKSLNI